MPENSLSGRDVLWMTAGRPPTQVACAAIFLLLSFVRVALGGATEEVAARRFVRSKIAVYGFLAPYATCSPRHRRKPFRVDVVLAFLADPEAAFPDATEGRASVSKLVEFAVEVINREGPLGSRLDLVQLIGASFNRDPVAKAGQVLEFNNPGR